MADWDKCEHDWWARPGDWDCPPDKREVICPKCNCCGEQDIETGTVFWPAT